MRHREKWRLALDMTQEMTGPVGWGVLDLVTAAGGARPVVAADIGYGDNALFREQLTAAAGRGDRRPGRSQDGEVTAVLIELPNRAHGALLLHHQITNR